MDPQKDPQFSSQPIPNPISSPSLTSQQPPYPQPSNQPTVNPQPLTITPQTQQYKPKGSSSWGGLKWYEYVICGTPLVLIFIGGLIGGGIGGGAFAINVKLWKSDKSQIVKVSAIIGITVGAFLLYFVLAVLVQSLFAGQS